MFTAIGLRPSQEDRLVMIPKLFHDDMAFCGVFDGTVGHHASEFLMRNIVDVMLQTEEMQQVMMPSSRVASTKVAFLTVARVIVTSWSKSQRELARKPLPTMK